MRQLGQRLQLDLDGRRGVRMVEVQQGSKSTAIPVLNAEAKGISAGRIAPDAFLQKELERGFAAARDGRMYNGAPATEPGMMA